jgi:hypothetical protein
VSVLAEAIDAEKKINPMLPRMPTMDPQYQELVAVYAEFRDANPLTTVRGENKLSHSNNYFIGRDPESWITDVPNYMKITYKNIYSGIDLSYYSADGGLKYDFIVHPKVNVSQIQICYSGINELILGSKGDLEIQTTYGVIHENKPVIYQEIDNQIKEVMGEYRILEPAVFGFEIGSYNSEIPLVIDPGLVYSTFLGGTIGEEPGGIAIDEDGSTYVMGNSDSPDFPVTPGAYNTTNNGDNDIIVTKLSPSGDKLVYSTFLGGTQNDMGGFGGAITVDTKGCAFITGYTESTDFPTTSGAYRTTYIGGMTDAFCTRLSPLGNTLEYSTYIGGNNLELPCAIAIDLKGSAFITGMTNSDDFPTTSGAYDITYNGDGDVFVIKLSAAGNVLIYGTYLGTFGEDVGYNIVVDENGCAFITGWTHLSDFPTTPGAYDTTYNGKSEAFVTKLSTLGNTLMYSSFLGGIDYDLGVGITVDAEGYAYVTGSTFSNDFPTTPEAYDTLFGGDWGDGFVTKLSPFGDALVYSTYLGGVYPDMGCSIGLDSRGYAYITGLTGSYDFPTTPGAFDTTYNYGDYDAFIARLSPLGDILMYSSYLGGNDYDQGWYIAVDGNGYASFSGVTHSSDFLTTPGAFDTTFNGGSRDIFVAKSHCRVIEIKIKGGFGINAVITNDGTDNITDVFWCLHVEGGLFGFINKTVNGKVDLSIGESKTVKTGLFLGFGPIKVTVNAGDGEETVKGRHFILFSIMR